MKTKRQIEVFSAGCPACDIRSVPAVVIDGTLADCCTGPDETTLQAAGLGQPIIGS